MQAKFLVLKRALTSSLSTDMMSVYVSILSVYFLIVRDRQFKSKRFFLKLPNYYLFLVLYRSPNIPQPHYHASWDFQIS